MYYTRLCSLYIGLSLLCWHNIENNWLQFGKNNAGIIGCLQSIIKELLGTKIAKYNEM